LELVATIGCETVKAVRESVVKERTTHAGSLPNVAVPQSAADTGIEVHEGEWSTVTVQHVYKMRCECGRSWFELELPKVVKCPACHKHGLVSG
jgi:hypothetical protein